MLEKYVHAELRLLVEEDNDKKKGGRERPQGISLDTPKELLFLVRWCEVCSASCTFFLVQDSEGCDLI